jgi:ankyrin repeat protein
MIESKSDQKILIRSAVASLDDKQQASLNAILYDAVIDRNLERVKLCVSRGAQTGPADMGEYFDGRNDAAAPLAHVAYRYYDAKVFEALVHSGMPIDEKDSSGRTALALAVTDQNYDCTKQFVALGANPLSVDDDGRTILDKARENSGYQSSSHDAILDTLLTAMPAAGNDFNASAPTPATSTAEDIQVSKPISLTPHKKASFQL